MAKRGHLGTPMNAGRQPQPPEEHAKKATTCRKCGGRIYSGDAVYKSPPGTRHAPDCGNTDFIPANRRSSYNSDDPTEASRAI